MAKELIKKTEANRGKESIIAKNVVVRVGRLDTVDVASYKTAVNAFKKGNRRLLYNLFENFDIDPFLSSVIGRMIDAVTNAELTFQVDGKNVEEIDDMIDSDEFEDFLSEIVRSIIYGKSVTECNFFPHFHVFAVPRKNIIITGLDKPLSERKKYIAFKETDTSGYDFTEDDHILECGKDEDLGAAHRALLGAIYKRNGFADWAQNIELFGQPFRTYKYHSHDTQTRDTLIDNATSQGGSNIAVVPIESEFKLEMANVSGSNNAYKGFKDACNEEILIAFLRNIMTTLSGNSEAQARIHKETEEDVYRALRRFVQRKLNSWFVPLLIKRGYKVTGGWFSFPDAGENISTKERVDMALTMRKAGLPVDEDYIFEISGVAKRADNTPPEPAPDGEGEGEGEGKAAKDKKGKQKDSKNPEKAPKEEKPPVDPSPGKSKKTEKESKEEQKLNDEENREPNKAPNHIVLSDRKSEVTDERNFILQLWDKAFSFFVDAPTKWSGAFQNFKGNLTRHITGKIQLSDGYSINIDQLINEAIKEVYGNKGEELINKKLFDITNDALQEGIDTSLTRDDVDEELVKQFKENAAVFSAFKNHQQTKEIAALMYDEEGKLVPFYKFKKEALKLSKMYNEQWLRTEYNTAVKRARAAANFLKFEKTKHLYPNLEYMPTSSTVPRESHEEFVGTILPIDDEAWEWLLPPSDFNCNHTVRQTDKEPTARPMRPADWNNIFTGNPAKTAEFVNTEETAYYKHTDAVLRNSVTNEGKRLHKENEGAKNVYKGKSGGYLEIVKQDKKEFEDNLKTYKTLADDGKKYKLLRTVEGQRSPDALNLDKGILSDSKVPITENLKNAFQNHLKKASKQKASEVVFRLEKEYSSATIHDALKDALHPNRNRNVEFVILIRKGRKPLYLSVKALLDRFKK